MKSWTEIGLKLAPRIGVTYIVIGLVMMLMQRWMIYVPNRDSLHALEAQAREVGLTSWTNRAGYHIGWRQLQPPERSVGRIIFFSGQVGMVLQRFRFERALVQTTRPGPWEVYFCEYPGFGARPGSPSQESLTDAAINAVDTLAETPGPPVFLFGESLGSGPACQAAAARPEIVAGVLLFTPFASLAQTAQGYYPIFPAKLMVWDRFDNIQALNQFSGRLLVVIAGQDRTVLSRDQRQLFDAYRGPKHAIEFPNAGHHSIDLSPQAPWWNEATEFLVGGER